MPTFLLFLILSIQGLTQPTGVVTGRVRFSDGRAAAGMRVSAMLAPEAGRQDTADVGALFSQTQADEDGRYRLEGISPGRYYVMAGRVDAPTYYPGREDVLAATPLSVASGKPIEGIDFTITESSASIPNPGSININVAIPVKFRAEAGGPIPILSPQGRIQLSAKPARSPAPAGGPITFQFTVNTNGAVVSATTGSGLVVLPTGRTTPAIVQVDGSGTVTVSAGEYRFSVDNLPPDFEVKAMSAGPVDLLRNPLVVNGPGAPEIKVTVGLKNPRPPRPAGRTIRGRVLDAITGKEWIAETVTLTGKPGTLFSDGAFEFHGVTAASYVLEAREGLPGDRMAYSNVVVGANDVTTSLTYTAVPAYVRVAGRIVVEDGSSLRLGNSRIFLTNTGTTFQVAADGTFKTSLSEGRYDVTVRNLPVGYSVKSISSGATELADRTLSIQPQNGPAAPDLVVTIASLPRFKVYGRVKADPPTRPVEGADVRLTMGPEDYNTTVAADGTFEIPRVLPGTYSLSIRPFGFTNVNVSAEVTDADVKLELTSNPLY